MADFREYQGANFVTEFLVHYGVGHDKGGHSGRFPWGSGDRPKQDLESNKGKKKERRGLTDTQKNAIRTAVRIAGTALVAYGAYKLQTSGSSHVQKLIQHGRNTIDDDLFKDAEIIKKDGSVVDENLKEYRDLFNKNLEKVSSNDSVSETIKKQISEAKTAGYKELNIVEPWSDCLKRVNIHKNDPDSTNNCASCGLAGYLRSIGIDTNSVKMKVGKDGLGFFQEIIKNPDKHILKIFDPSQKFARSQKDAAQMILKRFKDDGATGMLAVGWKNQDAGHFFNWKIENGTVKFFDFQVGKEDAVENGNYWKRIDPNYECFVARLDDAELDWNAVRKYAQR